MTRLPSFPTRRLQRLATGSCRLRSASSLNEATTNADIQAAAGLSRGSGALYKHFASKREFLDGVVEHFLETSGALRELTLAEPAGDLRTEVTLSARAVLVELPATGPHPDQLP